MSIRQDIRDKISRLNGKRFKRADIIDMNVHPSYNAFTSLIDRGEIIYADKNQLYFVASDILQSKKNKSDKVVLPGWRDVFPELFIHTKIKGMATIHKQAME